jgi:hypothetical protein
MLFAAVQESAFGKPPIRDIRCNGGYWGESGPAADAAESTQMTKAEMARA